jgi:hypothetical protein
MAKTNYGFSAISERFSSKQGNDFLTNLAQSSNSIITIARVTNIILDNINKDIFNSNGEWNGLGTIQYETIDKRVQINGFAKPIDSNIKKYPLLNELVYIMIAPNTDLGTNPYSINAYYISTINLWNHPHHNGYPNNPNNLPPSQQKDYTQTQAGSVRRVTDNSTEINLGKTFKEKADIHPLLPFEGDVIHEGRWGNSVRLGSTVKTTPNNWSSNGNNGDPITIIRNGQGTQTDQGWIPITENINNDDSSIYLTSTQNIPLEAKATSYVSYNKDEIPTSPSKYSGAQIILDSGRLVFNAYSDHILLSSAKSINLNSLESVNIDTKKFITQADKIFLGKEDLAKEPLLLGDTTAQLLRDLTSSIKELATALQFLQSAPVANGSPATFPTLLIPATKALGILDSLNNQLGTSPDSCTITSKRNFTV